MTYKNKTIIYGYITNKKNPFNIDCEYSQHLEWQKANSKFYYLNGKWDAEKAKSYAKRKGVLRGEISHTVEDWNNGGRDSNKIVATF